MKTRLTLTTPTFSTLLQRLGSQDHSFRPRYNIGCGQWHWLVRPVRHVRGQVEVVRSLWGLPSNMDRPLSYVTAESLSRRGLRKVARCVIPIDGFYGRLGDRMKDPIWFHAHNGSILWAAGIHGVDRQGRDAFALITCQANALVAQAQGRMPVLLTWREAPGWLSPTAEEPSLQAIMHPELTDCLRAREVSGRVNHPDLDDPLCIEAEAKAQQLSFF